MDKMSFVDLLKSSGEDFTSAIDVFKIHADRKGMEDKLRYCLAC